MRLSEDVSKLQGVGSVSAERLKKLDIHTIRDLLLHYPSYYKDSRNVGMLTTLDRSTKRTVEATLIEIKNIRTRGGKFLQIGKLSDEESILEVMWFNRPYLTKTLKPPVDLILSGKLNPKLTKPQLISPEFEIVQEDFSEKLNLGRIVPVYKLTSGISLRWLRARIKSIIQNIDVYEDFSDPLLKEIKDKYSLIDLNQALKYIHFPEKQEDIVISRRRLGFDELLEVQRKLLENRKLNLTSQTFPITINQNSIEKLIKSLPFELTRSQRTAIQEIHEDISQNIPMRRLLQGDVGSGKTIVAVLSFLPVLEMGLQVVVLAPTSILAHQHYESIKKLLPEKFKIGLVTSSSRNKHEKFDLIVGTHAILANKSSLIDKLGIVIIDEQHRFGVEQRKELQNFTGLRKPHLLQLTATPIPRTVALTLFGDYSVSKIIPPAQRKKVKTHLVTESKRTDSYRWIKTILDKDGQVFWILPVIEENESIKSINDFFPELKKEFRNYKLAKLHGKIRATEKEKILNKFASNKIDVLVSTTVVEVGIDIPGANLIVIESSERFGLAQLHQLRGRVGRNNQEAWCLLYYNESSNSKERLEFFAKEHDGTKIANYDLERRGPGEVYGTIQSGIPELKIARFSNLNQLKQAREAAEMLYF